MSDVRIGKSRVYASDLGLGTNAVGGHNIHPNLNDETGKDVIRTAINNGITVLDTAFAYGYGRSEELIGEVLQEPEFDRSRIIIATKAAHDPENNYQFNNSPEFLRKSVEEALQRLQTTYIDIFYIHFPDEATPKNEAIAALHQLKEEGKIRAIGVCNFYPDRLLDLCYNVEITPQINQIERHPHYQRKEDLEIMGELGIQVQAWAPFAEGMKGMFDEPILKEIAEKYGKTPAQVILRWNVQQGVIVIPKSVHRERMRENLNIWDFKLNEEDMMRIAELDKDCPSMLDTRKKSEVRRVYDYLNNPVLTSL